MLFEQSKGDKSIMNNNGKAIFSEELIMTYSMDKNSKRGSLKA
jgi:hypothetical protein